MSKDNKQRKYKSLIVHCCIVICVCLVYVKCSSACWICINKSRAIVPVVSKITTVIARSRWKLCLNSTRICSILVLDNMATCIDQMSQSPTVGTLVTRCLIHMMTVAFVAQRCSTNIVLPSTRLCWLIWCNLIILSDHCEVLWSLTLLRLLRGLGLFILWFILCCLVRWSWIAFSEKLTLPDLRFSQGGR